jgi:hypothetical protein
VQEDRTHHGRSQAFTAPATSHPPIESIRRTQTEPPHPGQLQNFKYFWLEFVIVAGPIGDHTLLHHRRFLPMAKNGSFSTGCRLVVLALFVIFALSGTAAQGINEAALERCRAIADEIARLRCFESITSEKSRAPPARSATIGRWRLVRSPHPQGGKDAVSIMRSAELAGSDPDFAGLVLRCSERDFEVLLVVIAPLSFRARPHVTLKTSNSKDEFEASVAPPGLLVLLPRDVTDLARGPWRTASQLSVLITDEQHMIRGSVLLADLQAASDLLVASCPPQ